MKILLVHADKFRWATQIRAESLKKEWKDDEVDIVDMWHLPDKKYDVVHILFSRGMDKIKDFIIKNKAFTTLASERTRIIPEIYKHSPCCVCQNRKLQEKLDGICKTVYIPNGVDTELFNRKFIVGFVGYEESNEHKGFNIVKKACDDLGLELLVANDLSHEEMPNFYNKISCLVLASESEGCNNPILEAMSMNIPIISTRVGIVDDLDGITLIYRDAGSLKDALRKVSGRIQMLENYTWPIIANKYHQLYVGE